jgi:sarcosine oxidase delta subunit
MGRPIFLPANCAAACFCDISNFGRQVDEQGKYTDEFCSDQAYDDWLFFMDDVRERVAEHWDVFTKTDRWLNHEDRVVMEAPSAVVGISQYAGVASVWLKSTREDDELAPAMADTFTQLFQELIPIAQADNGEVFFEHVSTADTD